LVRAAAAPRATLDAERREQKQDEELAGDGRVEIGLLSSLLSFSPVLPRSGGASPTEASLSPQR